MGGGSETGGRWGVTLSAGTVAKYSSGTGVFERDFGGISIDFDGDDRCLAIEGRSGTGKSTLLYILAGLKWPNAGGVSWRLPTAPGPIEWGALKDRGERLRASRFARQYVALAFQNAALLPHLTVWENLRFAARIRGQSEAAATRMARTWLPRFMIASSTEDPDAIGRRLPAALSGGQRQRVSLAKACASGAPLLFADEPTGNLDVQTRQLVLTVLRQWLDEAGDRVFVWVTHDRSDVVTMRARRKMTLHGPRAKDRPPTGRGVDRRAGAYGWTLEHTEGGSN